MGQADPDHVLFLCSLHSRGPTPSRRVGPYLKRSAVYHRRPIRNRPRSDSGLSPCGVPGPTVPGGNTIRGWGPQPARLRRAGSPPKAGPVAHDWVAMSYRPGWGADPGHHRPRYTGVSELRELGRLGSVRLWTSWEEVPEGVTGPLDAPCCCCCCRAPPRHQPTSVSSQ